MVEVMALGDEEGGDSPHPARPLLECLLPHEQNAPLPEQDASYIAVVDLRTPLNHVIDPVQVAEALERMRLVLLIKVAEDEVARRRMSTTLHEFYDVPDELAPEQRPPSASLGYRGADRAVVLQAATPEAAVPSRLVELAGQAKYRRQR
jgi:hypothetical protein